MSFVRRLSILLMLTLLSVDLTQSKEYHLVEYTDFHEEDAYIDSLVVDTVSWDDVFSENHVVDTLDAAISDTLLELATDTLLVESVDSLLPEVQDTIVIPKFVMGLKTNMLADVALIPNIGAEFYIDKGFTVGFNWLYAWWSSDRKQRSWRIYGGDLNARMYLGKLAKELPLQGHHVGVYVQAYTYDFAWNGKGILGGESGGHFFDRVNYGVGAEYGYSLPIYHCLNIDFTLGLGYFGGIYYDYTFDEDCYVWQATKRRHFFGPTKAEVSLVWRIEGKTLRDNKQTGGYSATILAIEKKGGKK